MHSVTSLGNTCQPINVTHLNFTQAAKALGIDGRSVRRFCESNKWPIVSTGRAHWIPRHYVEKFLRGSTESTGQDEQRHPNDPRLMHPMTGEEIRNRILFELSEEGAQRLADMQAIFGTDNNGEWLDVFIKPAGLAIFAELALSGHIKFCVIPPRRKQK
jgi:hypothetical protein